MKSARQQAPATILFAAAAGLYALTLFGGLRANELLDSESAGLSSVVVEFLNSGRWWYPMHAPEIYEPGFSTFVMHPPLHYRLAAAWASRFGVGVWQLSVEGVVVCLVGGLLAATAAFIRRGPLAGLLTLVLLMGCPEFVIRSVSLRPDAMLGVSFALWVHVACCLRFRVRSTGTVAHSLSLGLLTIVCVSSHWFGLFAVALLSLECVRSFAAPDKGRMNVAAALLGVLVGLAIWYSIAGNDLWKSLIFAPLLGVAIREGYSMGFGFLLQPFASSWGGVMGIGLLVTGVGVLGNRNRGFGSVAGAFCGGWRPGPTESAMMTYALLYITGFIALAGNRHPQYWMNLYFLLAPLAATGLVALGERLLALGGLAGRVAFAGLLMMVATSSFDVPQKYAWRSGGLARTDETSREIQMAVDRLIAPTSRVLVGSDGFPFVAHRPFESTMRVVSGAVMKPVRGESFIQTMQLYFKQRASTNGMSLFASPPEGIRAGLRDVETMLLSPGHFFQGVIRQNPSIWGSEFREFAVIFLLPEGNARRLQTPYTILTVFARTDVLENRAWKLKAIENSLMVGEHIGIMVFSVNQGRAVRPTSREWQGMKDPDRVGVLRSFLEEHRWFGLRIPQVRRDQFVLELLSDINVYMDNPIVGTLGQAIDYAAASVFPRFGEFVGPENNLATALSKP